MKIFETATDRWRPETAYLQRRLKYRYTLLKNEAAIDRRPGHKSFKEAKPFG